MPCLKIQITRMNLSDLSLMVIGQVFLTLCLATLLVKGTHEAIIIELGVISEFHQRGVN